MIDSEVHTEAVIRNAFCSYYGKDPRGFTRALVAETCNLLDKIYWQTNPLYQGDEFRADVLFSRQSVLGYANNLLERRKGNFPSKLGILQERVGKLDFKTLYEALDSFGTHLYRADSVRHAREIIQRLQKGRLDEEEAEEQEEAIANFDIESILSGFVEVRGLYFPNGEEDYTHTITIEGDKELCIMNPFGRLTVENITDNQFLDKLISSLGGSGLIDSQLAAKLRAIDLPEYVSVGRSFPDAGYYVQGGSFRVRSPRNDKAYLLVGISEPPKIVTRNEKLSEMVESYLRSEDLMCAISIQKIVRNYDINPVDVMDILIELLKERRIKIANEDGKLVFHGSNKSSNTLRDILQGICNS